MLYYGGLHVQELSPHQSLAESCVKKESNGVPLSCWEASLCRHLLETSLCLVAAMASLSVVHCTTMQASTKYIHVKSDIAVMAPFRPQPFSCSEAEGSGSDGEAEFTLSLVHVFSPRS